MDEDWIEIAAYRAVLILIWIFIGLRAIQNLIKEKIRFKKNNVGRES